MILQPTSETVKQLQSIVESLFTRTAADRTTIRIDTPNDRDYPVLAEARRDGVSSITGGMSLKGYKPVDIHQTSTVRFLKHHREYIIQNDATKDPPLLPELVEYYGITGQMLAPIEHHGDFVGLVSVHSVHPREWTASDITILREATADVHSVLERATWVSL